MAMALVASHSGTAFAAGPQVKAGQTEETSGPNSAPSLIEPYSQSANIFWD